MRLIHEPSQPTADASSNTRSTRKRTHALSLSLSKRMSAPTAASLHLNAMQVARVIGKRHEQHTIAPGWTESEESKIGCFAFFWTDKLYFVLYHEVYYHHTLLSLVI